MIYTLSLGSIVATIDDDNAGQVVTPERAADYLTRLAQVVYATYAALPDEPAECVDDATESTQD